MRYVSAPLIVFLLITAASIAAPVNREAFQYLSPRPDAELVSPETSIAIRPGAALAEECLFDHRILRVDGSSSGAVRGRLSLSDDRKTLFFTPSLAFVAGEQVRVRLREGLLTTEGSELPAIDYRFTVAGNFLRPRIEDQIAALHKELGPLALSTAAERKSSPRERILNSVNGGLPANFPPIEIVVDNQPSDGYIFASPFAFGDQSAKPTFLMILDNHATPVFYRKVDPFVLDFKVQPNGSLSYWAPDVQGYRTMDSNFTLGKHYRMKNGYTTDFHGIQILPNGHSFMMSYDRQPLDMSKVVEGGREDAIVIGLVLQELDASDNVVFEWRSWDHFAITDAVDSVSLKDSVVDYSHGNSIEVDSDTSLIVSSRHMDEITKIDRRSGEIIWRFGGENNQFTFINDERRFSHQHDARILPNGNLLLFDNGNFHKERWSSAVEYILDDVNMTATLVRRIRMEPDTYGAFMGSAQRLPGGNTVMGWGNGNPLITEHNVDGKAALAFEIPRFNYRAFKFPWQTTLFTTNVTTVELGDIAVDEDRVYFVAISNNAERDVAITGVSCREESALDVKADFPLLLKPNHSVRLPVTIRPLAEAAFDELLTINSDSNVPEDTSRIARQVRFRAQAVQSDIAPAASLYPSDAAINIPTDENLTVAFTRPVRKSDGGALSNDDLAQFLVLRSEDVNGEDVAFTAEIDNDAQRIRISPNAPLAELQDYYLALLTGLADENDRQVAAVESRFRTHTITPPTLNFFPADGSQSVALDVIITLSFNKPIRNADNSLLRNEDLTDLLQLRENDANGAAVAFSASIDQAMQTLSIRPQSLLAKQQLYYVAVEPQLEDFFNNAFEGGNAQFRTGDVTDVEEPEESVMLRVYPQPSDGLVNLELICADEAEWNLKVLDFLGRSIIVRERLVDDRLQLDLRAQAAGVYLIELHSRRSGKTLTHTLLKQ